MNVTFWQFTKMRRTPLSIRRVETFVKVLIAKIHLRHGSATYCSSGHPPTMLLRRDASGGVEAELLSVQSGVVGAFPSMVYENGAFAFNPGDILFMYRRRGGAVERSVGRCGGVSLHGV